MEKINYTYTRERLLPGFDGVLDSQTASSLRGFQRLAGLPETGSLDRITWHHLVRQFTLNAAHNSHPGAN